MTSILLNDQNISLLDGVVDGGTVKINSFASIKTDLNLNEIATEPSLKVKIENQIKSTLEENGMTTNHVVILFSDSQILSKPIIAEQHKSSNEIEKILPIELKASLREYFQKDKQSYYLIENFAQHNGYDIFLSLSSPKHNLEYAENLVKFLQPNEFNVSIENIALINFMLTSKKTPENFVLINFLSNGESEILIFYKNKMHSIFKIYCGKDLSDYNKVASKLSFISDMLSYQFPDDIFSASVYSSIPDFNYDLSEILPKLNLEIFELTSLLTEIQSTNNVDSSKLLPFISLIGTLFKTD